MVKDFEPKKIICLITTDRFKYTCKNIHLDPQKHEINNTYRFNKDVPYLVKNKEDYEEMLSLDMFEAYEEKIEKTETEKERKAREKEEAKKLEKDSKKNKEAEKDLKTVPSEQTDGADSITERPVSE